MCKCVRVCLWNRGVGDNIWVDWLNESEQVCMCLHVCVFLYVGVFVCVSACVRV